MIGRLDKEHNKYILETDIPCYHVDSQFRLKPASFMDMAQEIAYLAATVMGFGYDDLDKEGKVWVLSRMNIKFHRTPLWREHVVLSTWHKGARGPFYLRDFQMCAPSGEVLVTATSSWVLLDVAKRTMCRTAEIMEILGEDTTCNEDAIAEPASKIAMPRGVDPDQSGVHKVEYSDVDLVGHTNNARYMVWAMDCIDFAELKDRTVKELTINFVHETKPDDYVNLEKVRVESAEGVSYFIDGKTDGRQAFCVRIDL